MAAVKTTYTVAEAGFLFGDYYKAGDTIDLHPAQAKYDLPPHGSMLTLPAAGSPSPTKKKPAPEGAN